MWLDILSWWSGCNLGLEHVILSTATLNDTYSLLFFKRIKEGSDSQTYFSSSNHRS